MFHPRKKPRFTSTGTIATLSDDEEENVTNLTPPDKYTSDIPSFESLLAIPQAFVLTHVRNPNEAVLIFEIGVLGTKLDTLVQFLVIQLQQEEVLDRKWRSICNSRDPLSAAYIPSLAQLNQTHFHHQTKLTKHFHECINALKVCKQSLMQYVEMNKSVAEELLAEGCVALAANKITVGKTEEMLLSRIDGLLNGNPFVHTSISWDSLINDKSTNTTSLLHDPSIVKTESAKLNPTLSTQDISTNKPSNTDKQDKTDKSKKTGELGEEDKSDKLDKIEKPNLEVEEGADKMNISISVDAGSPFLFESDLSQMETSIVQGSMSSNSESSGSSGNNSSKNSTSESENSDKSDKSEKESKNNTSVSSSGSENTSKEIGTSSGSSGNNHNDAENNNNVNESEVREEEREGERQGEEEKKKRQKKSVLADLDIFFGSSQAEEGRESENEDIQWQSSQLSQTGTPIT